MTSERWGRIEQIYNAALLRAPSERALFLEQACGGDDGLRRDVERLLTANDQAGSFLASQAWDIAANELTVAKMTEDRDLSLVGRQIGGYQVLAPLGVGGMGEVYRALDTTLNRDVALKVLPERFALDVDRVARFRREAHVLASLNHPNIAAIHGFEEAPSTSSGQAAVYALVLELVEGPTLADRIGRGSIPLEDALPIARQIVEALEAAHERGVIHRDLKPANIKVRPDGAVKVLDFGLAKVLEPESIGADPSHSPTAHDPAATQPGLIIGTAAYMAPEQARGRPADKRADMWAFGCVLYEMLSGVRAFSGQDVSETLAAVIRGEPDWHALTDETPAPIRRLLRRCLAKDPKGRLSDASVARLEIDEALSGPLLDIPAAQTPSRRKERFAWASVLMLVAALAVAIAVWALRPLPPAGELRFEINTPATTDPASLAISPDGRKIVFVAMSEGRAKLWLRRFDSGSAAPLPGTDGAMAPFWSPDSRTVAFFTNTDDQLKRLDIDGRSLQALGRFPLGIGGTWNQDGTILFATLSELGPIRRIPATGGEPSAVTRLEAPRQAHFFPQFLPDGRRFLFHVPVPAPAGLYVGQLDGSGTQRLVDSDDGPGAVYVSGHLLFLQQGALFAQAFDPVRLVLSGSPLRVAEHVKAMSASSTGTVVYRTGSAGIDSARPLVWFDRSGTELGKVGDPENVTRNPSLSPDGRHVALMGGNGPPGIWLLPLDRGTLTRFTLDAALVQLDPVWSPDGSRLVFSSNRTGRSDLYQKPVTAAGKEELLLSTPEAKAASDWSADGRFLLYGTYFDPQMGMDIWALSLDDRKPFEVVRTNFDEKDGQFSPDGKWIAYQSNETGRFEIYVQPFPGPGRREPISTNGGAQVRWRRDGRELFYIALDGRLMAVPIRFPTEGHVEAGAPVPLFATRVGGAVRGPDRQQYAVSADGQRFLMSTVEMSTSPISVILNWKPQP
jgi:eukaryotic-like serine/threonine-protein kinase